VKSPPANPAAEYQRYSGQSDFLFCIGQRAPFSHDSRTIGAGRGIREAVASPQTLSLTTAASFFIAQTAPILYRRRVSSNKMSARSQLMRGFAVQISNCNPKSAKLNNHLPLSLISHRDQNVPSIARVAAGAFGFLTLIQLFDGANRWHPRGSCLRV
jgi:hypothetical protein